MKIAVIGGGISGLTVARLLAGDGHDVVVLESAERPGGLCRSRRIEGFTFDLAGGHILFSKREDVLAWQIERCGGGESVVRNERRTRIRWHDRYVPYPFENGVGHLPKDVIVECMEGYVEAHVQRRLGVPCPASFGDWIDWRMGPGFARHFMVPYNEKIWKCDLRRMTSAWVAGRVPEAPVRDILKAAVGIDTQGYRHQSIFYFPLEGGFERLVQGTLADAGFDLRTGTRVEHVRRVGDRFSVDGEDFDLVINTAPLPKIEPAIEEIPQDIRDDIRALRPISLVNVLLGVELEEPLPALSWVYLPFPEQGPANRVTFFSNYSPRNAPEGHGSFMAEVTHRGELRPDSQWLEDLARALGRAGILDPRRVVLSAFENSEYAYIDQDLEFPQRIRRVREWFDGSGYITFGRFGRYEYHNSDQCISRAMEVFEHVRELARSGDPARPVFS